MTPAPEPPFALPIQYDRQSAWLKDAGGVPLASIHVSMMRGTPFPDQVGEYIAAAVNEYARERHPEIAAMLDSMASSI